MLSSDIKAGRLIRPPCDPIAGLTRSHDHETRDDRRARGAALLAGCGDDNSSDDGAAKKAPAGSGAATTKIDIKDFLYSPDAATVKVGAKVSVTNEDSAPHTLTDKGTPAAFDSDTIKQNETKTVTFMKAGTFKYYCQFHPTMAGTITVTQ